MLARHIIVRVTPVEIQERRDLPIDIFVIFMAHPIDDELRGNSHDIAGLIAEVVNLDAGIGGIFRVLSATKAQHAQPIAGVGAPAHVSLVVDATWRIQSRPYTL